MEWRKGLLGIGPAALLDSKGKRGEIGSSGLNFPPENKLGFQPETRVTSG